MMRTLRMNLGCFLTNYRISCSLALRRFSSLEEGDSAHSSPAILDLLLREYQFPPQLASNVASVLNRVEDPKKSLSTLSFLKESGFSNAQLQRVATFRPTVVLSTNLENGIKPKIGFFKEFGFSSDDIAVIISKEPSILHRNFNTRVIPSLSMLKGLLGSDDAVVKVLKKSGWFLASDLGKTMVPNVEFLKSRGVPMERIRRLLLKNPRSLLFTPYTFREFVEKAEELGADRSSNMFIYAIRVVSGLSHKNLEVKLQAFRNCEFSDVDIAKMFKKMPPVFGLSVEKVKRVRDVILATGKYNMSCIVNYPISLCRSVEKTYNPRFRVLEILERKNLIKKWPKLSTVSSISDEYFFKMFVCPYLSEVGDVYTMKVNESCKGE